MSTLYGIIAWLILGGLAGWIGGKIMGTEARQGLLTNIFIGMVGAVVGGFLASALFGYGWSGHNGVLMNFLVALAGACLVIFGWTKMSRRRA